MVIFVVTDGVLGARNLPVQWSEGFRGDQSTLWSHIRHLLPADRCRRSLIAIRNEGFRIEDCRIAGSGIAKDDGLVSIYFRPT